jgi:haloalkane dehalogenase
MPIIRTSEERFKSLPGFSFAPHYVEINGLRVHYVDEGKGDVILCLHGEPTWSYLYRKAIPLLSERHRVIAMDFIGFGRSDKFTQTGEYSFDLFFRVLEGFIDKLNLGKITLVGQDGGALIGLNVAARQPGRFARLVAMNTDLPTGDGPLNIMFSNVRQLVEIEPDVPIGLIIRRGLAHGYRFTDEVIAAYEAPFPDEQSKAGAAAWPLLYPTAPDAPSAADMRRTRDALARWQKPALFMSGEEDPIYAGTHNQLRKLIPSAQKEPEIVIQQAGHFLLEEKGEEAARLILDFMKRTKTGG